MTAPALQLPTAPPTEGIQGPKTLARLSSAWAQCSDVAEFEGLWWQFVDRSGEAIRGAERQAAHVLSALPRYYLDEVRPATPYLFREWMPLGYAAIVAVPDNEVHARAAAALLRYGFAVTLLDDVADTDEFEERFGPGISEQIATEVNRRLWDPGRKRRALPAGAERIAEIAVHELHEFSAEVDALVAAPSGRSRVRQRALEFLDSVVTCRRVRRRLRLGIDDDRDLSDLRNAAPQGMTVVMVGLLGSLLHPQPGAAWRVHALRDAATAERICHYQNALATLDRERESGDPTNPIVVESIRAGRLDAREYLSREMDPSRFREATEGPRVALEQELARMTTRFEMRGEAYRRAGAADFFQRLRFGVRNLGLLYRVARGEV